MSKPIPTSTTHQAYSSISPDPDESVAIGDSDVLNQDAQNPPESSPHGLLTEKIRPRRKSIYHECAAWWFELGACLLAGLSVMAIVLTLYSYQDKPFPHWPLYISINSLLSIYGVIYSASILAVLAPCLGQLQWQWFYERPRPLLDMVRFDDATRGPMGSISLIWAQRLRQPLAIAGAITMISSVIVDPFIQELAQTSDCRITIPNEANPASLPRTNVWPSAYEMSDMQKAQAVGIFSDGKSSYLSGECATGNCTFGNAYSTVGLCSSCTDITSKIQVKVTGAGETTSSLPSGLNMTYNYYTYGYHTGSPIFVADVWRDTTQQSPYAATHHVEFLAGKIPDETMFGRQITEVAVTCSIDPCVRSYEASVEAGKWSERLTEQSDVQWGSLEYLDISDSTDTRRPGDPNLLDLHCVSAEQQSFLVKQGYDLEDTTQQRWLGIGLPNINMWDDATTPSADRDYLMENVKSLLDSNCLYIMSKNLMLGGRLLNVLSSSLSGTLSHKVQDIFVSDGSSSTGTGVDSSMEVLYGTQSLESIYNSGRGLSFDGIAQNVSSMAESLTWYLRNSGDDNYSKPAKGTTHHYATCLDVEWKWIAFPAALWACTSLLLVCVVGMTVTRNLPAWKGAPLAWHLGGPLGETLVEVAARAGGGGGDGQQQSPGVKMMATTAAETPNTVDRMKDVSAKVMVALRDIKAANPHIEIVN